MGLFGGRRPRPRWPCWRRWGWFGLEQEEPSPPPETRPRQVAPPLSACTGLHYSANIKLALDWAINAFLILADASACLDVLPFPALQFGSFNFFLFVRSDRCSCSISVAPGKKKKRAGFYDSLFLKNNSATSLGLFFSVTWNSKIELHSEFDFLCDCSSLFFFYMLVNSRSPLVLMFMGHCN